MSAALGMKPFKTCACGRVFDRVEWEMLPFVGVQPLTTEEGPARADLRNCACNSTIAVLLPEGVSVCTFDGCGSWIEGETKSAGPLGVVCSEHTLAVVKETAAYSRCA